MKQAVFAADLKGGRKLARKGLIPKPVLVADGLFEISAAAFIPSLYEPSSEQWVQVI